MRDREVASILKARKFKVINKGCVEKEGHFVSLQLIYRKEENEYVATAIDLGTRTHFEKLIISQEFVRIFGRSLKKAS